MRTQDQLPATEWGLIRAAVQDAMARIEDKDYCCLAWDLNYDPRPPSPLTHDPHAKNITLETMAKLEFLCEVRKSYPYLKLIDGTRIHLPERFAPGLNLYSETEKGRVDLRLNQLLKLADWLQQRHERKAARDNPIL